MNTLRRKLQFQLIQSGGGLKVLQPSENQEIILGIPFDFEVLTNLSDTVDVYINSTKIAILTVENGKAEGTMTISSKGFTLGSIFLVDGSSETQISNRYVGSLKFVSGEEEVEVSVVLIDTNNYFDITPETSVTFEIITNS